MHPIIPWSMKCGKYTFKGLRYLWILDVKYITHCISDHEFCQDPCSLVTTVASDNRNRWGLLSLGMQGFDRLVSSNRRSCRGTISSCVKPKTSIQQTYFDPTAIEPGSWKDSSIEKYTHESESSSLGGELLWDHQAGTSLNTKSNFQKAIETWKWDETVNEFLPTKLTDKGSPIVTIWSNPWYFYLKNQLCLSASTTFVSFDGRGTQQALKIVWRSPPWFPESLAGFWCLETIQERRSLWSPAKKKTNYKIHIDLLYPREPFQNTSSVLWA